MNVTDPIADMLTRIRNGCQVKHKKVEIPASNLKINIAQVFYEEGYIRGYKVIKDDKQGVIEVYLKYTQDGDSVIQGLRRYSKSGLRKYATVEELPRVESGLGVAVISTSKGLMPDRKARRENVGGEVLFFVW